MTIASQQMNHEAELDAALAQSQADFAAGRFVEESAAAHMARLKKMLAADAGSPLDGAGQSGYSVQTS